MIPGAIMAAELQVDEHIITKIEQALHKPVGHRFEVKWNYSVLGDAWEGIGTLSILGSQYLELILPYQTVLIQDSTVATHYSDTDQVVIDRFGRNDSSSFFSILLGDFSGFSVRTISKIEENKVHISLIAETLVGFDRLDITVNSSDWLPVSIKGSMGSDARVAVMVESISSLENPERLINRSLQGREVIDLR